jgi:hypothetical protein
VINPTISLSINPGTVTPGQSATIAWSASGASLCTAMGAWSGSQSNSGSLNVTLTSPATQTYTLQCNSDSGGFAQQSATLAAPSVGVVCSPNAAAAARRAGRRHIANSHS